LGVRKVGWLGFERVDPWDSYLVSKLVGWWEVLLAFHWVVLMDYYSVVVWEVAWVCQWAASLVFSTVDLLVLTKGVCLVDQMDLLMDVKKVDW